MKWPAVKCLCPWLTRYAYFAIATSWLLWLAMTPGAHAQVIILSEDFEGAFPEGNGWTVWDANPDGTSAFWEDVNSSFGGEGAHGGFWKGYCAGSFYPFNSVEPNPLYQHSMQAIMEQTIDLSGYAGAELRFWYKIPSLDDYYESLRVYVDGPAIFARDTAAAAWKVAIVSLSQFVGGSHTLRFEFSTDTFTLHEGCYLDDIVVLGYSSPLNDQFANATSISGAMGSANGFSHGATKEA